MGHYLVSVGQTGVDKEYVVLDIEEYLPVPDIIEKIIKSGVHIRKDLLIHIKKYKKHARIVNTSDGERSFMQIIDPYADSASRNKVFFRLHTIVEEPEYNPYSNTLGQAQYNYRPVFPQVRYGPPCPVCGCRYTEKRSSLDKTIGSHRNGWLSRQSLSDYYCLNCGHLWF